MSAGSCRPLMILGCTSDAGKSLLTAALCRWFSRQGVRVAPFKAQNMSNNARVVTGGEIGVAQWLQARAAGVEPTVDMNPVLVKPETDTASQVVVHGAARRDLSEMAWDDRHDLMWDAMSTSYARIQSSHDLVILEGAGSPAEINLRDQVNNRMIAHADAAGLLVSDIDRGGSFAHLYGTWALVPDATRDRLAGYVLNKFRGDAGLLSPGPERLTEMTGMSHVGTLPMLTHQLPDEEAATVRSKPAGPAPTVAIVRFPFGSNLDEFRLLDQVAHVVYSADPAEISNANWVILPGSKHVASDLRWMRSRGLDRAIHTAAAAGRHVIGVCGGAMMLGRRIEDPHQIEGDSVDGLGVLDHVTTMEPDKLVSHVVIDVDGRRVRGYEIRHGAGLPQFVRRGRVVATTVHGLFESLELLDDWFDPSVTPLDPLESTFDLLADSVSEHLDTALLRRVSG